MADYYPLIARAVAGLEQNTGENRRGLYERARGALVAQLRGTTPALEESDITRERLALEDAIRRVEGESARRNRVETPVESGQERAAPPPSSSPSALGRAAGPSLSDQGLKGFRDVVAEAERLGDATSAAAKSARDTQDDAARRRFASSPDQSPPLESRSDAGFDPKFAPHDSFDPPPSHDEPTPRDSTSEAPRSETELPSEFEAERMPSQRDGKQPDALLDSSANTLPESWPEPALTSPRYVENEDDFRPRRSWRGAIKVAAIALLIAGVAAAGYWQRDRIGSMFASLRSSPMPTAPGAQPAPSRQKIADRVGGDQAPGARSSTSPTADVAQKVVLYDEDPNDAQGKRYVGSAIWRTETVSPGPGLAPELAIRADVEIPERRIRMTWSLRRNTDRALPASHTIEIMFALPADFPEGGISNVPGVLMKQNEQARGVPLAGLAVKVTNGFFLIGLSAVEVDLARNIQLLKERSWFDVPIVYNNNKRAILAIEKGSPGERLFQEAFRAWGQ